MKAIILVGGKGTRLMPLTQNKPKPMVEILGYPMLEYGVELLKKYGIRDFCFAVGYKPEAIEAYFKDGRDFGVNICYSHDLEENEKHLDKVLGTAGCVKKAADKIVNGKPFIDNEDFLVINGDVFCNINLTEAIDIHKKHNPLATVVLTRVADVTGLGVAQVDDSGTITSFIEKPDPATFRGEPVINAGIYVFGKDILKEVPDDLPDTGYDISKNIFTDIANGNAKVTGVLQSYISDAYWADVGTIPALERVNRYVKTHYNEFAMPKGFLKPSEK